MTDSHNHDHDHDHGDVFHSHAPSGKMGKAFFLTLFILAAEVVGGLISKSLALLADSGHVITDLGAIGLSWFALRQAEKPADLNRTYGYHRAGILAAFINGLTLIVITVVILWEAIRRFAHPEPISSTWMFVGAVIGLLINLYLGLGMRHEENVNVKSAVLHMLGDAAASAGVIAGGIIILFTHWYVVDPILSVCIAILIAFSAWKIVKQTLGILMEGTPKNIDIDKVKQTITTIQGVKEVHDLHVWSITEGKNALSCHAVMDGALTLSKCQEIIDKIRQQLKELGIGHVTIQPEDQDHSHPDPDLWGEHEPSHSH